MTIINLREEISGESIHINKHEIRIRVRKSKRERERERETDRQTERQRDGGGVFQRLTDIYCICLTPKDAH